MKELDSQFASALVKPFKQSTMKIFMTLVNEVAAERIGNTLDTMMQLTFSKSGCKMVGYTPMIIDLYLEKIIRKLI